MQRIILFYLISLVISASGVAQLQRNTGQMTGSIYPSTTVEAFSPAVRQDPNDNYLYKEWLFASIDLNHSSHLDIQQIPLRYNVVKAELEVKAGDKIKVIPLERVREVNILSPGSGTYRFVNSDEGFVEEVFHGDNWKAYIKYDFKTLAPDYNAQFDTGSRVPVNVVKETYYIKNLKNGDIYDYRLKKSSFVRVFKKGYPNLYKQLKKQDMIIDDKSSLADAVRICDGLID